MCGIVCVFNFNENIESLRPELLKMAKNIRHRGPDWSGIFSSKNAIMCHERLAIVDPTSGQQPLFNANKTNILAVNGEIYNYKELESNLNIDYKFQTKSDCEVILPLYEEKGVDFLNDLNGMFGFTIYDKNKNDFLIARDQMGIIPLYIGYDKQKNIYVASELKALEGVCNEIKLFPPGHYLTKEMKKPKAWYVKSWKNYDNVKDVKTSIKKIHDSLEAAVKRQLMSDVPYAVLLSGGLDSSVISAIAKKYSKKRIESDDKSSAWWPQLHSFAVGLKGSPDLIAAQKMADHIGTIHHEVNFTVQEGIDAISDVVYFLETYDVTTIRASTPMYLLARVIKSMGIKIVLSGEGSDELFGGYLYFHKAPNAKEFHEETVRKLDNLHKYDCLRANKSLAACGIEGRVPFLDKEFIDVAMQECNPKDKMITPQRMEKWLLRKAFEDYLPKEITWRQKEQFSDGVGYDWIDRLKEMVDSKVSDEQMKQAKETFPIQTPKNKEEFFYRSIFAEHFPSDTASLLVPSVASIACSTPTAIAWDESFKNMSDPSGRSVKAHDESL